MKKFLRLVALVGLMGCLTSFSFPLVSLHGSKKVAKHQNAVADKENLSRIANDAQLNRFIKNGLLIRLEDTVFIKLDPRLDKKYHYVRPWTLDFLNDLGMHFGAKFPNSSLQINSAVRTTESQKALRRVNGNAAPTDGPTQSSHTTGATVDIAKKDLSADQMEWLGNYLREKKEAGKIDAVEEKHQSVFHVMVFKNAIATKQTQKKDRIRSATKKKAVQKAKKTAEKKAKHPNH